MRLVAGLNLPLDFHKHFRLENSSLMGEYAHPDNMEDSSRLEQSQKPDSKAWVAPVY